MVSLSWVFLSIDPLLNTLFLSSRRNAIFVKGLCRDLHTSLLLSFYCTYDVVTTRYSTLYFLFLCPSQRNNLKFLGLCRHLPKPQANSILTLTFLLYPVQATGIAISDELLGIYEEVKLRHVCTYFFFFLVLVD